MINRLPKIVYLAINFNESLVQMPLLVRVCGHFLNTFTESFSSKHRTKSVPSVPHSFMADADPALVEHVLAITERKRKSNVHYDRLADDLGTAVKAFEWACFRDE